MEDGTEEVVPELRFTEGLVTALMGQHPDSGHHRALGVPVHRPEDVRRPHGESRVVDPRGEVAEDSDDGEVRDEVGETDEEVSTR